MTAFSTPMEGAAVSQRDWEVHTSANVTPSHRPLWLPLPFILPIACCGVSWAGGGIPVLTDIGFVLLLLFCFIVMTMETFAFTRRFGIGGVTLSAGIIVWYCHDYFSDWFGMNFAQGGLSYTAATVAKGAFYTTVFAMCSMIGLLLPVWRRIPSATRRLPEPPQQNIYITVILLTFFIGMIPYIFFSAEPFYINIYKAMTGLRTNGAGFTEGRTGNYNYSWGGYLAQVEQVGSVGSIFAIFYVIMKPGFSFSKIVAFLIWLFWSMICFGGGSRGELMSVVLPVGALIFLRFMQFAAARGQRFSGKAVFYPGLLVIVVLFIVQIQGSFRDTGFNTIDLQSVSLFKAQGDTMFSEGLLGYETFPDVKDFTSDTFPGSRYVMAVPDEIVRFAIGWIPRVLWHNKPGISSVGQWYNEEISGGTAANDVEGETQTQVTGGTVCPSICGNAYMGYGLPGVIQMGLLFGWLCKVSERIMWANMGRVLGTMFSLGMAVYLFRAFRDLTPHDFYPLCIGVGAAGFLIWVLSGFNVRPVRQQAYPDNLAYA